MSSPIRASGMLNTADRLAGRGAARGRPALCDLRRATSSAYYALFHQITRHGALNAVNTATEDDIEVVARWFTHTGIRKAATWVVMADNTAKTPPKADLSSVQLLRTLPHPQPPAELLTIAETFIRLQDARHNADYSNSYDPVRYTTLSHVDEARDAVETTWKLWRGFWASQQQKRDLHDTYDRFLTLSLLASGGPKVR